MTGSPAATTAPTEGAAPSWQQRLVAKRRRRVVVPVQVSADAGDLAARVERLRGIHALLADLPTSTAQQREQAAATLAAAEVELAGHVVDVEFQSLPPAEFEALAAAHPSTDPADDSGLDWRSALPALAAACCLEDGGSDEAWWTDTLAAPCWTSADLLTLWGALLRLHTRAPSARLPFA